MDIDPAGRDQQAGRVDRLAGRGGDLADLGDAPVLYRDIRDEWPDTCSINDCAAFDDPVLHDFPAQDRLSYREAKLGEDEHDWRGMSKVYKDE